MHTLPSDCLETAMTASTFDTLSAADKLRGAGLGDVQARAIVDSIRDAQATGIEHLATKADIARLEGRIDGLEGRLNVLQWVIGIQSAVLLAIGLRVFGLV